MYTKPGFADKNVANTSIGAMFHVFVNCVLWLY